MSDMATRKSDARSTVVRTLLANLGNEAVDVAVVRYAMATVPAFTVDREALDAACANDVAATEVVAIVRAALIGYITTGADALAFIERQVPTVYDDATRARLNSAYVWLRAHLG